MSMHGDVEDAEPTVGNAVRRSFGEQGSLVELIERHAVVQADKSAFLYLEDGDKVAATLTYARLAVRVRALAARLRTDCRPAERVLLALPSSIDYVVGLLACLCAGLVAVPVFLPDTDKRRNRLRAIVRDCGPRVALTTRDGSQYFGVRAGLYPDLAALAVVVAQDVDDALADAWIPMASYDDAPALLQYTSGRSSGAPKGISISHRNLVYNLEMMRAAFATGPSSTIVNWLPLHRDMGLIGNVLHAFWVGGMCVLMPKTAFIEQPLRWLRAVERFKAAFSGGPNFSFDLCVQALAAAEAAGEPVRLDLSHWHVAFNGGEPVRHRSVERFVQAFAPHGFARRALRPCYGLTEATLIVSASPPSLPSPVRRVPPRLLDLPDDDAAGIDSEPPMLVSCGRALLGERLRVVDPVTCAELPLGLVGEIWVAGGHVADGYWLAPQATHQTFDAYIFGTGEGPFLRTGDLGLLDGGELYVTGRLAHSDEAVPAARAGAPALS